jgi:hypothetical protein
MSNNTTLPLTLSGVQFEAQPGYEASSVGCVVAVGHEEDACDDFLDVRARQRRCRVLSPGDVLHHVFQLVVSREASGRVCTVEGSSSLLSCSRLWLCRCCFSRSLQGSGPPVPP